MLKLGVEADILVGRGCWCNFGGAQANWISDKSQGAWGSREPGAGVSFALSDDFRGSPDFFLGDRDMEFVRASAAAARAWRCDSNRSHDNMTTGFS